MTQIGSVIDGKYRVIDQIGEGGMSIVWLVTDSRLNKQWAIKEIKKNARTETHKVIVDSLRAEANLMKGLDHPALPRIVDIIEDGDSLYVVMDFIQGEDLLSIMKNHRRVITEADVVDWGIQLCDALTYLHSKGIVYRDMKPGNVMLMNDGMVKIIDFGIAREYSPDKEDDTMPLGTRGYASPEAFKRGVQTTPVSDIYSLGVTLFHLVTGHGPMEYVDQPTLPPIRAINPALSQGLENVIIKATQWAPAERYQSCNDMRYDLENLDKLTDEYVKHLKRSMTMFKVCAIAGAACLVLGIGLMAASNLVRGSSYDDVMVRAATASTEEQGGNPSQAEQLYTQAIGIMDSNIEPYSALLNNVYKADSEFTLSEASRWAALHEANRSAISNDEAYAKLCYDAGVDYFIYYSYGNELTRGKQAVSWFEAAIADYDLRRERNQPCTMTEAERNAAQVYKTIGEFSDLLSRATQEGVEGQSYADYWDALETAVANLDNGDAVIVRLRMCNVVFEAINSPVYLAGFNRAGVSETRVMSLLNDVHQKALDLQADAAVNESTAQLCDNIVDNYQAAVSNVESTYHNAGARAGSASANAANANGAGTSGSSQNGRGGRIMTPQEVLFIASIVFFVLAAVFIVAAVVVFFVRNIPDVRADLSGKKRADAVQKIATQRPGRDRRKGVARVEPTSGNLDSGNLREPSPLDNPLNQVPHVNSVVTPAPEFKPVEEPPRQMAQPQPQPQPSAAPAPKAEGKSDDSVTTVLPDDDSATSVLADDDSATSILASDDSATTILPGDDSATTILPAAEQADHAALNAALEPTESDDITANDERQHLAWEKADSATADEPAHDDAATTVLSVESAQESPAIAQAPIAAQAGFVVVRKIVLSESTEFIKAGQ